MQRASANECSNEWICRREPRKLGNLLDLLASLVGKHGHPFPVPLETDDASLTVLRRSLEAACLGVTEKYEGFRGIDRLTLKVAKEREPLPDFDTAIRHERAISRSIGGRTVFEEETPKKPSVPTPQSARFEMRASSTLERLRWKANPHRGLVHRRKRLGF